MNPVRTIRVSALLFHVLIFLPLNSLFAQNPSPVPEEYLPKVHGRQWTYAVIREGCFPVPSGFVLHRLTYPDGSVGWNWPLRGSTSMVWTPTSLNLFYYDTGSVVRQFDFDFSIEDGGTYQSDNVQVTMMRNQSVTVEAGVFTDCVRFYIQGIGGTGHPMWGSWSDIWFARGYGPVLCQTSDLGSLRLLRKVDPIPTAEGLSDARSSGRVVIFYPSRYDNADYFQNVTGRINQDVYGGRATLVRVSKPALGPRSEEPEYWIGETPFDPSQHIGAFETLIVISHAGTADGPNFEYGSGKSFQPWTLRAWQEQLGPMISAQGKVILRGCHLAMPTDFFIESSSYAQLVARASGRTVFAVASSDWMGLDEVIQSTTAVEAGEILQFLIRADPAP